MQLSMRETLSWTVMREVSMLIRAVRTIKFFDTLSIARRRHNVVHKVVRWNNLFS